MRSFNLRQVKLRPGEEHREKIELELEPFELGGERYLPVPGTLPALLAITKATSGLVFDLRFTTRLHGPCYRCLGDAVLEVPVDAREYQAASNPVCGKNLNDETHEHPEETGDSRWSALESLREQL